jgi:hypothetical protein
MKKVVFVLAILSLFLTACSEKVDLYFESDQHWRADMSLTVDEAAMDLLMQFGVAGLTEELGLPELPSSALESETWIGLSLDMLTREWQNMGMDARWNKAGNTYAIFLGGEGYYQLQSALFEAITLTQISASPETWQLMGAFGVPDDDLAILSAGLLDYENTISIHTGEILDCNACEINKGIATWRNPGSIQVTFTPRRSFNFPWQILLAILGFLIVVAVIAFIASRASGVKCPECGRRVRKGQEVCPHCGGAMGTQDVTYVL